MRFRVAYEACPDDGLDLLRAGLELVLLHSTIHKANSRRPQAAAHKLAAPTVQQYRYYTKQRDIGTRSAVGSDGNMQTKSKSAAKLLNTLAGTRSLSGPLTSHATYAHSHTQCLLN